MCSRTSRGEDGEHSKPPALDGEIERGIAHIGCSTVDVGGGVGVVPLGGRDFTPPFLRTLLDSEGCGPSINSEINRRGCTIFPTGGRYNQGRGAAPIENNKKPSGRESTLNSESTKESRRGIITLLEDISTATAECDARSLSYDDNSYNEFDRREGFMRSYGNMSISSSEDDRRVRMERKSGDLDLFDW